MAIIGEPGAGKTSLLTAALEQTSAEHVLFAQCSPVGQHIPFGGLHQLFGALARSVEVSHHPFDGPGNMLHELLLTGATQADQVALTYSVRWVLACLAEQGTVRLAVDDVQWMDEISLALLGDAWSLLGETPLVLACTVRAGAYLNEPSLQPLLGPALAVNIDPLSVEGVRSLLGTRDLDPVEVHGTTGGLPFYVNEVLDQYDRGDRAALSSKLSSTVGVRLTRLGPAHIAVANALVVLDVHATVGTIAHLTSLTVDKVAHILDNLVYEGLATVTPQIGVRHPLVHAVLVDRIGPAALALLHDRTAASLADQHFPLHVVAPHVLAGTPTRTPERVHTLWEYGKALRATGSSADARPYLDLALAELGADSGEREALLEDVASARLDSGDFLGAAEALSERATYATEPTDAALRYAAVGDVHLAAGDPASAGAAYERGFAALEDARSSTDDPLVRELAARALAAQLTLAPQLHELPERILREVAAQDPSLDTLSDARMMVSAGLGSMMTSQGLGPEELTPLMVRAYARWPKGQFGFSLDPMLYIFTGVLNYLDMFTHGVEILDSAVTDAQSAGNGQFEATALYCRGAMHLSAGDIRRATADLDSAVSARHAGWVQYREAAETMLARCLIWQGDIEGARAVVEYPPNPQLGPFLRAVRLVGAAEVAIAQGDPARGLALALEARDLVPAGLEPTGLHWQPPTFAAQMAMGDTEAALAVALNEIEMAVDHGAASSTTGAAMLRAAFAQEGQPGNLARVEHALTVIPPQRTFVIAQGRELLARELIAAGRTSEAGTPLAEALRYARHHRLSPLESRLVALAKQVDIPVTPTVTEHRLAQLSQAEYRVVALAADGLSNKEIAARLFVTVKTVEFHLSRSFRKLDISSRRQLQQLTEGRSAGFASKPATAGPTV